MHHPQAPRHVLLAASALAGAVAWAQASTAQAQPRVQVNGVILQLSVAPVRVGGRTLVPMRAIFQALGAPVSYNRLTQEVTAQSGSANVRLRIGQRSALVNGKRVVLDQAPILRRGSTLVPLRFVAEGLGADVHWDDAQQLASVSTKGTAGQPGRAIAGSRTIVIPADSVVPVRLNEALSSGDARVGDIFTARVVSRTAGDSEFPPNSNLEGVVTDVRRERGGEPGVMRVEFRAVVLPDGARFPIRGQIIPLDEDAVRTNAQGRVLARPAATRGGNLQVIGIGGFTLGRMEAGRVLGATGGTLYNAAQARRRAGAAILPRGASLGVRLTNAVSYGDSTNYSFQRGQFLNGTGGSGAQ